MRILTRAAVPSAVMLALTAGLDGCKGVVVASSTVAGVSRVPAVITSTGGSFSVGATGSGGRTFTGSLTWTCGS